MGSCQRNKGKIGRETNNKSFKIFIHELLYIGSWNIPEQTTAFTNFSSKHDNYSAANIPRKQLFELPNHFQMTQKNQAPRWNKEHRHRKCNLLRVTAFLLLFQVSRVQRGLSSLILKHLGAAMPYNVLWPFVCSRFFSREQSCVTWGNLTELSDKCQN